MINLILAAQIAAAATQVDSTYSSAALREAVARAASANRLVPRELQAYRSHVETEVSLLVRDTLGREQTASIEQFASTATWDRGGQYDLHVVGYRSQSVGVPYSTLTIVRAWTVPSLYGNRLSLGAYFTNARRSDTLIAVHPFADDRDRYYQFSGGDTVATIQSGTRRIPLVRIRARPHLNTGTRLGAFDGEIDVDAERWHIVRMRGRFVVAGRPPNRRGALARVLGIEGVAYAEFVNAEVDGKYWLPAFQRTEFQASFPVLGQVRPIFRLVSSISGIAVNAAGGGSDSVGVPRVVMTWAPSDSLNGFGDWVHNMGSQTAGAHADDFQDLAPESWRADGPPRLNLFPTTAGRILRFNRVEGLFTGVAPTVDFRSLAPGLSTGAWVGWAWSEQTARGGASISYRRAQTTLALRGERAIASTNDFVLPLEEDPGFAALLGSVDNNDYIDRRLAMLSATRILGSVSTGIATAQIGVAQDAPERARISHGLFAGGTSFAANRGAAAGRYLRGVMDVELHPDVTGDYVDPGVGARAHYELATGDLDWQRVELSLSARKYLGPVSIAAHADGGMVVGGSPPPQTLFELGGTEALPGYEFKEFVGDRAALFRIFSSYRLGLWRRPIRLFRNLLIPGVSPGIAASAQGGWSELSSSGAVAAARQLVAGTSVIAEPTHGFRSTVGAGVTIFSDIIHLGVARPIDHPAPWKFVVGFGGRF